jgi:hypothetical protein
MNADRSIKRFILFNALILALLASGLFTPVKAAGDSKSRGQKRTGKSETETLKAEDKEGIPVPANYTDYSSEKSRYRHSITAASPSSLKTLLEFYRTELKAEKWNELPGSAVVEEKKASLVLENGQKERLVLKLALNAAGGTDISAGVKSESAARKDGILPPTGMARIYLGNATDVQVVFTVDKKKFTVKKQSIADNSMKDAPFVDVKPGKHSYTLTGSGLAAVKDIIEAGSDETWGLIAGPGGAMPLQMY